MGKGWQIIAGKKNGESVASGGKKAAGNLPWMSKTWVTGEDLGR